MAESLDPCVHRPEVRSGPRPPPRAFRPWQGEQLARNSDAPSLAPALPFPGLRGPVAGAAAGASPPATKPVNTSAAVAESRRDAFAESCPCTFKCPGILHGLRAIPECTFAPVILAFVLFTRARAPCPQNFTRMARSRRFSRLRRSGVHPATTDPGIPMFPPGGVTPPEPEKYGTLAARWSYSQRKVMYWLGM